MAQATERKAADAKAAFFTGVFSSFSVNDLKKAKDFYSQTLGIDVAEQEEGLALQIDNADQIFLYPKSDHAPATFTVLNFQVNDIEEAVDELAGRGINFESYGGEIKTDEKGIFRGKKNGNGPNIAWFKDPSGNILSIMEE
jgi:predicted enzyme related to lactoylglutathione lyase